VFGSVTAEKIRAMQKGAMIDGVKYRGVRHNSINSIDTDDSLVPNQETLSAV
jgi:hypothetical protein